MKNKEKIFQLRYDDQEKDMLKKLAESKGLSASGYLRMLIRTEHAKLSRKS